MNSPETVLALMEELIIRNGLEIALSNRNEEELEDIVNFIIIKISDHRY